MIAKLKSRIDGLTITSFQVSCKGPGGLPEIENTEIGYIIERLPQRSGPAIVGKVNFTDTWTPEIREMAGSLISAMERHIVLNSPLFESPTEVPAMTSITPIIPWGGDGGGNDN